MTIKHRNKNGNTEEQEWCNQEGEREKQLPEVEKGRKDRVHALEALPPQLSVHPHPPTTLLHTQRDALFIKKYSLLWPKPIQHIQHLPLTRNMDTHLVPKQETAGDIPPNCAIRL